MLIVKYKRLHVFQDCLFFIQKIQVRDAKNERPKYSWNFVRQKKRNFCEALKNSSKICQHRKKKLNKYLMLQLLACNCANKGLHPEYCDNVH